MKNILLKRVTMNEDGTFGVMIYNNVPFLLTIERPWKDNQKGISAIPDGTYTVKRTVTPKHGDTFEVCNVPNRSAILIHTANTEGDLEGCIGVGTQFGKVISIDPDTRETEDQPAVLYSKVAYSILDDIIGKDTEFTLVITWSNV